MLFADYFSLRIGCQNKTAVGPDIKMSSTSVKDWCVVNNLSINRGK